jgi:hypothetical protein
MVTDANVDAADVKFNANLGRYFPGFTLSCVNIRKPHSLIGDGAPLFVSEVEIVERHVGKMQEGVSKFE